ncbi:MAG: hypothetical protein ACYDC1_17660 [Limisphaerales bacterium]
MTISKATVTFASGYAKRMMEAQYTRVMESELGKQASRLSRPSKYAVEAVLNGIVAYLAMRESTITNTPAKEFLWEMAKDVPSEISKRLLNGDPSTLTGPATLDDQITEDDKRTVLDGLLRMEANDLATFLSWLKNATPEERREMSETMSKLKEEEQKKRVALTSEQVRTLLASSPEPVSRKRPRPSEVQADLDAANRRLDDELHERQVKRKVQP